MTIDTIRAPLVGLYSRAPQSGKSTLANAVAGFGWQTVKFASVLKGMVRAMLAEAGCPHLDIERMVEGDLKEVPTPFLAGRTPRHAMQTLGTDWGRQHMAATLWVDLAMQKVANLRRQGFAVVMDDMRFPNEARAIREAGGSTVEITNPLVTPAAAIGHVSEGSLDGWDFDLTVVNGYSSAVAYALSEGPRLSAWAYEQPGASISRVPANTIPDNT